jgi:Ni,Fe-hydrogenase III large subunit
MADAIAAVSEGQRNAAAFRNGTSFLTGDIPTVDPEGLRREALALCRDGGRIAAFFALPRAGSDAGHDVFLVVAQDGLNSLRVLRTRLLSGSSLPSLSAELAQAQAFERELHELHGLSIVGHPWLKSLRKHPQIVGRSGNGSQSDVHPFFQVRGPGIHEVAVGPVHAGIIEPGHFRFQCHGEEVLSLEIHLGYQHRGAESLLLRSSPARRLVIAESIAGDTAIGHASAYCMAMEGLGGASLPLSAHSLRGIALELERLANHIGDLGALAGDVAYLPGASYFGRLRGNFLNLLLALSGNRYGRGLLSVGGVRLGLDAAMRKTFLERLRKDESELEAVAELMFDTPSVLSRFEDTGVVSMQTARDLGLVGPVARASGLQRDVRHDHPAGIFRFAHVPVTVATSGDVMARALVRWLEVQRSLTFVQEQIRELPEGPLAAKVEAALPNRMVVAIVEGWRGEIAHVAMTDEKGQLRGYKIVDPSFHNWFGLSMALRGNQISDFPLCNKSFNLSYAGHDL